MFELLTLVILLPIIFITVFVLKLSFRLLTFALILAIKLLRLLLMGVKKLFCWICREIVLLWQRYRASRPSACH